MTDDRRNAKAEALARGIPAALAAEIMWGLGVASAVWLLIVTAAWYHDRDDGRPLA